MKREIDIEDENGVSEVVEFFIFFVDIVTVGEIGDTGNEEISSVSSEKVSKSGFWKNVYDGEGKEYSGSEVVEEVALMHCVKV